MSDSNIAARAEQIVAMMNADEREEVLRKLPSQAGKPASLHAVAIALAEQEKKTGTRTGRIKLVKALMKAAKTHEGMAK